MRLVEGLTYGIRVATARELEIKTTFHQAIDIARRIERIAARVERLLYGIRELIQWFQCYLIWR